jgi:DNA-binding NarL/FixJ family response regulator
VREPGIITKVLVVDNSGEEQLLEGELLERSPGISAIYATQGPEALTAIRQYAPDVVLMALHMPKMNDLGLFEEVRNKYPALPVVLMTVDGDEGMVVNALKRGAAGYLPKKSLVRDLTKTLQNVQALARKERRKQRLLGYLTQTEASFSLNNDPTLIQPVVAYLQESITRMRLCDEAGCVQVGIALHEALLNALFHGNLEVSSELREMGESVYLELAEQRRQQLPFRDRRIYVTARTSPCEAVYIVRDEGAGFDPASLPDSTDPANIGKVSGRGILLIRTFMDEVTYNGAGNQITMIKRQNDPGEQKA